MPKKKSLSKSITTGGLKLFVYPFARNVYPCARRHWRASPLWRVKRCRLGECGLQKNDEMHIIDKRHQPNKAAVVRSLSAKMAMSPSPNLLHSVSVGSHAPVMQIFTIGQEVVPNSLGQIYCLRMGWGLVVLQVFGADKIPRAPGSTIQKRPFGDMEAGINYI